MESPGHHYAAGVIAEMNGDATAALEEYRQAGVEIRVAESLPLKLALFDCSRGMIALLDPVITRPAWTSVVFDHEGFGEAMKGLFEDHWRRAMGSTFDAQG